MTRLLFPVLVALVPLLITPGLLFHYDVIPKVAVLAIGMMIVVARPARLLNDLAELWRTQLGKSLCAVATVQVIWTGVATLVSSRPLMSLMGSNWRRLGFITVVALCFLVVSCAAHLRGRFDRQVDVLRAVSIAAVLISVYAISQYFQIDPFQNGAGYRAQDGDFTIVRPPGTLGHADYLGWWLAIAIFCCWGLQRIEEGVWRRLALAGTVLSGVAIVLSGTRSAIVATVAGFGFLLLSGRVKLNRRHVVYAASGCAVALLFYIAPPGEALRARVKWSTDEEPGGGRPLLWRDSFKMAVRRPAAGYGPETFAAQFPRFQSEELSRLVPDFYHESPHNAVLDAFASEGVPGLLLAIAWFAIGSIAVIRKRRRASAVDVALSGAFVASCAASLFNSLTIGPAVMSAAVLAMLVATEEEPGFAGTVNKAGKLSKPWLVVTVPAAGALLIFAGFLLYSDYKLEQFEKLAAAHDIGGAMNEWKDLRKLPWGAADDLYCSRRLASLCSAGTEAVARLECSLAATQAAARGTETADNPPNAWYNLAMFAAAHNDAPGAERALRRTIDLAPNWFRPHRALANYLTSAGRIQEARPHLQRAAWLEAGKAGHSGEAAKAVAEVR